MPAGKQATKEPAALMWVWVLILTISPLAIACNGSGGAEIPPPNKTDRVRVVTTTALLADLVKNVGRDRVNVRSIVPAGADVHSFQTTPDDSITISRAQMIVSNGFHLDAFLDPILERAMSTGTVHVVAAEPMNSDTSNQGYEGEGSDPHFWQNPEFAIAYVQRIQDGLVKVDPEHGPAYRANAEAYASDLRDLDTEIGETLNDVPPELRHLVTFHDAFRHWGQHYGWRVSAFVDSDSDEVTPETVVQVLKQIEKESIPAVFAGPQFQTSIIQQTASDAGISVGTIYSDLSKTGPSTYIEMMELNAQSIANHLK